MTSATGCRNRCRTSDCSTVSQLVLAALTLTATVSGLAIPLEVSRSDEISSKSREISLPEQISRRCAPVPHHVLWLRLNIAPKLPSNVANGPQNDDELPRTISLNDIVAQSQPDVETDSPPQDGDRRHRRDTEEVGPTLQPEVDTNSRLQDGGVRRRRHRRHRRRHKEQKGEHRRRHRGKPARRRANLLAQLSDGEAWQCHMKTHWVRMPDDVFPPYVQTGSCAQSRCMMGLYECRPRRYATRVLRRLPGRCNPLPYVGESVSGGFEESWVAEEYHVTVGCECSKRRASGWYDDSV